MDNKLPTGNKIPNMSKNKINSNPNDIQRLNEAKNRGTQHNFVNSNAKHNQQNSQVEEKSKFQQVKEGVEKQAASAGLQAAGVPKPLADLASEQVVGQVKKKMKWWIFGSAAGCALWGLILIVILGAVFSAIAAVSEALSPVTDFFASLGNWFAGNGWCPNAEACEEKAESDFYQKISDLYDEYNAEGIEIDKEVLAAAALYNNYSDFNGITTDPTLTEEEKENQDEYENTQSFKDGESRLADLAKNLVNTSNQSVDYNKFKRYLTSFYIPEYYDELLTGDQDEIKYRKNQIANEILAFSANAEIFESVYTSTGIYEECPGVTVVSKDGATEGTYTLEEYVAGVLAHEVNNTWGSEALKAHAVAVRSYTIARTNNCTKTIENSTSDQTFKETDDPIFINAVQETAGQVLMYDDKIISAEYSAWYDPDICTGEMSCDDKTCTVDMVKLPNKEEWQFTMDKNYFTYGKNIGTNLIKDVKTLGGHCRGMSQFGIKYLDLGKHEKYDDILYTFYSEGVEIGSLTQMERQGLIAGNYEGFYERTEPYNANVLEYQCGVQVGGHTLGCGNFAQCVWYVKRRAIEIFNTLEGIDEETRQKAITAIYNSYGNGRDWWDRAVEPGGPLSIFGVSSDYTQPKIGAIVVWEFTQENANNKYGGHNYGHVAIVENIDEANGTVTVTEGYRKGGSNGSWDSGENWSQAGFLRQTQTYEQLANRSGYVFRGYVYLLD